MPSLAEARQTLSKIPVKIRKVMIGGVFWTKLELSLIKIRKRILNKSRPAFPFASASLRRAKQNIFLYIFLIARRQIFFQLRKRKFICFAFLLTEELRKRSHPIVCFRETGKRAKIPFSRPLCFLPVCFRASSDFFSAGFHHDF